MNIYEVETIEREIERIALENDGEIPEELFQELVEAQTKSLESVERMCKFIRHLEMKQEAAKAEIDRINKIKQSAENRVASIKKYMLPYLQKAGKVEAGLFKLSIRKSEKTILEKDFFNEAYCEEVTTYKADKTAIKKALKSGIDVPGAELIEIDNVQVKL
jgi:uncharacterized membrane protein YheB (UPF0754 family)